MAVNACSLTPEQILELSPSDKAGLSAHDIATCFNATGTAVTEYNMEAGLRLPLSPDNVAADYQNQINAFGSLYKLQAPISDSTGIPVPTPTIPVPPPPPPPLWKRTWFIILMSVIFAILWLPALIMSGLCFGKQSLMKDKIIGLFLALIFGPFYWLYYHFNKSYCNVLTFTQSGGRKKRNTRK